MFIFVCCCLLGTHNYIKLFIIYLFTVSKQARLDLPTFPTKSSKAYHNLTNIATPP